MLLVWLAIAGAVGVAIWYFAKKKDDVASASAQSVSTALWNILHSPNMPTSMLAGEGGYYFDFPAVPGSVHYVTRSDPGGRSIVKMRFKIIGDGPLFPTEGDPPARVRAFLQRRGDNLSGAGEFEHYRFWSAPTDLVAGETAVEFALDPALWTSVYGRTDSDGFASCLANLESAGFTFGGMFAGHGVYTAGQARFVLLEFSM